ncbi:MAG TPA: MATE family efflux transporter [Spirochaetota bacterium]|nr:MATE family efflux transporter [Spirochaetota bacterium]HPJ33905.1 MATE family efflux transporter [Spirochaetota bacterium]
MHQSKSPHSLGHVNIGKLLLEYSLPAIVAMTAMSLYNIIDRIFIGQGVGALAISGLALTLPLMNLGIALGALVGAGASTMVSIRLGEKREDEAALILGNTVILNLLLSIPYSVIMLIFLDEVLYMFGASAATLPFAKEFMQLILIGNVFIHSYMGLNHVMRASGYPRKAMNITLITVGINIILAPIFIFVLKLGIRGASLATVLAQTSGLIMVILHFMKKSSFLHFKMERFSLRRDIIRDIFSIGMSPFIINVCVCLIVIIINRKLVIYGGDYAVGAYGIINSILMFVVMVILGLTQGMQPIAGYNFGALHFDRVKLVFRYTVIIASIVSSTGFLLGEFLPRQIAMAFTDNTELIELSVTGMRTVMIMFPLAGFQIVTSNLFQSIGKAKISVILTLSRQVIFLIPALMLLPGIFGLIGVWAAIPAADLLSTIFTFFILKRQGKKILGA